MPRPAVAERVCSGGQCGGESEVVGDRGEGLAGSLKLGVRVPPGRRVGRVADDADDDRGGHAGGLQ